MRHTLNVAEPWTPVETPAQGGWRFFKVGVEMRSAQLYLFHEDYVHRQI